MPPSCGEHNSGATKYDFSSDSGVGRASGTSDTASERRVESNVDLDPCASISPIGSLFSSQSFSIQLMTK